MGTALSTSTCCGAPSDPEPSLKPFKPASTTGELIYRIFGNKELPEAYKGWTKQAAAQAIASNVDANYDFVLQNAKRGDVTSVLNAMDSFGYATFPMIGLGDVNGSFVDAQVEELKPTIAVVLGANSGYAALRLAREMKDQVGSSAHVYAFETWKPFADTAAKIVDFAGLSSMITIINGGLDEKIIELKTRGVETIDLVLINHCPEEYLRDLHVLEYSGLLQKGVVVLANNIAGKDQFFFYRTYVNASRKFETRAEDSVVEYKNDCPDAIEISTYLGPLSPKSQARSDELMFHIFGEQGNIPLGPEHTTETLCSVVSQNVPDNFEYVTKKATRGDVTSVIDAMDEFGYTHFPMMSIGDVKGAFMDSQVELLKPKVVVELGTFTGYGAIRFARKMREVVGPSAHVYTFEVWEPFADYAAKIIEFAGMSDMITIIRGKFSDTVEQLKQYGVDHTDILLIDHNKKLYLSDLHVAEDNGLLKKGSIVLADNVVFLHMDEYREYVRSSPLYETRLEESVMEYKNDDYDGIEVSTFMGA